jgi:phage terminase large subunit-like protein
MLNPAPTFSQPVGLWKPWDTYEEMTEGVDLNSLTDEQLKKLFDLKVECERRKRTSPIMFYKPYESKRKAEWYPQLEFHKSHAPIKMFIAGNRAGKTVSGAAEVSLASEGLHPFTRYPKPMDIWVVSLTNQMSIEVAEAEIRKLIGRASIRRWDRQYRVLYLVNGSRIGFKSCEQDINTFGGTSKDLIWFDEEPPGEHGYQIYKECRMRTIDRGGRIIFTLTPVQGMSWTADEIYEPAIAGDPNFFIIEASTYDNPHLSEATIKEIEKDCTEDEKEMRFYGKYIQFSGLVYKEFDRTLHIIEPHDVPSYCKRYRSIDHGINNPTSCHWYYVNEREEHVCYDEYYQMGKTVAENAEAIKTITGNDKIEWTTIDPSTDNRDPISGSSIRQEYAKHGITTRAIRADVMSGVNTCKQRLKVNDVTKRPGFFVFRTCYAWIKEIQRYRWQQYRGSNDRNLAEAPQKVLDHAMDDWRYFERSNPRFKSEDDEPEEAVQSWYR